MPEPIYAIRTPRQLKVKYNRILEIIAADPGIGLDGIFQAYYDSIVNNPITKRKQLSNLLTSMCINNQLTYIKGIDGYVVK